ELQLPPEHLGWMHRGGVQLDRVRLHQPVEDGAGVFVLGQRDAELELAAGAGPAWVAGWRVHCIFGHCCPPIVVCVVRKLVALDCHSITSSALSSSVCGTLRPSVLAVLRLTPSSNLVGSCTGKSAGGMPLSTRST